MKNRIMGELKKVFRPEFLNRIDDVIVFHKLQKDEIKQIVELLLLRIRESMAERELQLELTEAAKDLLVEKGWDPAMGARPLRRAIQRYIEDPLADFVLRAQLTPGATVVVEPGAEGDDEDEVKLSIVKPEKQPTPVGVGAEGGAERATSDADARGRGRRASGRARVAALASDVAPARAAGSGRCRRAAELGASGRVGVRRRPVGWRGWRHAKPTSVHVCSACGHETPSGTASARLRGVEHARRGGRARRRRAAARRGGGARRRRARGARARRCALREVEARRRVDAPEHRHRRARPRARRRARAGLAGAARRLARDRQVDAHEHGARQPRGAGHGARSTSAARSRPSRSGCAPSGWRGRRRRCAVPVARRDRPRRPCSTTLERGAPRGVRDRLGADAALGRAVAARRARSARCARSPARIMELAKARRIAVILVGHVTKEGALAGPRVLEHLVDCVLQFEGERERPYRELRALKNRFGSTNEAGLFEMRQGGLVEVLDASARFVAEATRAPGSVVLAAMEGSRPLLVEVQALVAPSELEQPRRVVVGLDRNRLALVLRSSAATAASRTGGADVFVNVVGGVRVDEPGCDLAVALAVASAAPRRAAAATASRAAGVLRRARPDRRAALGRPPRAAPGRGGASTACSDVIAPPDSGAGACEAATLREALALRGSRGARSRRSGGRRARLVEPRLPAAVAAPATRR